MNGKTGLNLLIAFVLLLAAGLLAWAGLHWSDANAQLLVSLCILAIVSEAFDFAPFAGCRISMSIALILTAAVFSGLPGIAAVSLVTAAADHAWHRKPVYKSAFNAGVLVIAGGAFVGVLEAFSPVYESGDWLAMLGPVTVGGVAVFAVNSGLVALAMALATGTDSIQVWSRNFRWVLPHYVLISVLALFLATAYDRWEFGGLALLLGPLAMSWLALKQFTDRSSDSSQIAPGPSQP